MSIWSDNKYIDYLINGMLFLMAVNFMHFGQLVLPVICLLLFVDNHFRLNFGNTNIFVLLCLFGISFFAFSYKLGFYSVMGLCLPMAYYIGSNIKNPSEDNVKKILYIIAFGMCLHVILNGVYDMYLHFSTGKYYSTSHYDFWTKGKMSSTATALNINILLGMLYYIIRYEKNKALKVISFISFSLAMIYCLFAGRRTPVLLLVICLAISFMYEGFVKDVLSKRQKNIFTALFVAMVLIVGIIGVGYETNFLNCQEFFNKFYIIYKFRQGIIDNSRINLFISGVKLAPDHMFGGQEISAILEWPIHDLWSDIFDFAGIVPWVIMLVYSFCYLAVIVKMIKSKKICDEFRVMMIAIFVCIILQMMLEPAMTGSSIFVIVSILIESMIERILANE